MRCLMITLQLYQRRFLTKKGVFISEFLGIAEGKQITTNIARYELKEGAYTELENPSPDIYEQILEQYEKMEIDINTLESEVDARTKINDDEIRNDETYSSVKIEQLIATTNYKQAVLKQTVSSSGATGVSSGSVYIYQIANIVFMDFVNMLITGSVTDSTVFTYSEEAGAPLHLVKQEINNATITIESKSREVKVTTSGGYFYGTVMYLTDSVSEEGGQTIADILSALADVNTKIETINIIPADYVRRNLAEPITDATDSRYSVSDGVFSVKSGTTVLHARVTKDKSIKAGTYTVTFFTTNPDPDCKFYGQVRQLDSEGNMIGTLSNRAYFTSEEQSVTFKISEDTYYCLYIVCNTEDAYELPNDISVKFTLVSGSAALPFEHYVDDVQTRITALENKVAELEDKAGL